jgi:hypothetical protein
VSDNPKSNRRKWLLAGAFGLALWAVYLSWPGDAGRALRLAVFRDDRAQVERILRKQPELVNLANIPVKQLQVQSRPRSGSRNFMEELTIFIWDKLFMGPVSRDHRNDEFVDLESAGLTPLQIATLKGNVEISRLLLERAADVKASSPIGYQSIHFAASQKPELMELLLKHGADPNATNRFGATPLQMGLHNQHSKTLELLLKAGADPNALNRNGATPLHTAAVSPSSQNALRLLWQHGARLDITNRQGKTALDMAHQYKQTNAIEFLSTRPGSKP